MAASPAVLEALPLAAAVLKARQGAARQVWTPLPGPQSAAYESEADELFYGGSAGGGKTDLLLGLAVTRHRKALILRREYKQLADVVERSREVVGGRGRFNGTAGLWRLDDGRMIELGAVEHEWDRDKWKGRAHDLKAFDEVSDFTESQYRFLIAWNRTTVPGQRCRVVAAGNPPTSAEGEWVIRHWGPWLDLGAPKWLMRAGGIQIESKEDVKKQLGRSPDCGDAVVLAWWSDLRQVWARSLGQRALLSRPDPRAPGTSPLGRMRTGMVGTRRYTAGGRRVTW